jgi:hypothetical protein
MRLQRKGISKSTSKGKYGLPLYPISRKISNMLYLLHIGAVLAWKSTKHNCIFISHQFGNYSLA